ncbi:hypothetical protein ACIRD3_39430 [Kitasatospora sp. NPDC093550]|uniref:hypothetical protein n=1 Tax=Kitasatospora sp. NPDC093550 TaxID=3364089 RepID=UPI00381B2C7E
MTTDKRPLIDPRLVALLLPVLPLLWSRLRTLLMIGGGLLVLGIRLSLLDTLALVLVVTVVLTLEALASLPHPAGVRRTTVVGGTR